MNNDGGRSTLVLLCDFSSVHMVVVLQMQTSVLRVKIVNSSSSLAIASKADVKPLSWRKFGSIYQH